MSKKNKEQLVDKDTGDSFDSGIPRINNKRKKTVDESRSRRDGEDFNSDFIQADENSNSLDFVNRLLYVKLKQAIALSEAFQAIGTNLISVDLKYISPEPTWAEEIVSEIDGMLRVSSRLSDDDKIRFNATDRLIYMQQELCVAVNNAILETDKNLAIVFNGMSFRPSIGLVPIYNLLTKVQSKINWQMKITTNNFRSLSDSFTELALDAFTTVARTYLNQGRGIFASIKKGEFASSSGVTFTNKATSKKDQRKLERLFPDEKFSTINIIGAENYFSKSVNEGDLTLDSNFFQYEGDGKKGTIRVFVNSNILIPIDIPFDEQSWEVINEALFRERYYTSTLIPNISLTDGQHPNCGSVIGIPGHVFDLITHSDHVALLNARMLNNWIGDEFDTVMQIVNSSNSVKLLNLADKVGAEVSMSLLNYKGDKKTDQKVFAWHLIDSLRIDQSGWIAKLNLVNTKTTIINNDGTKHELESNTYTNTMYNNIFSRRRNLAEDADQILFATISEEYYSGDSISVITSDKRSLSTRFKVKAYFASEKNRDIISKILDKINVATVEYDYNRVRRYTLGDYLSLSIINEEEFTLLATVGIYL